jgi:hypothetical protein
VPRSHHLLASVALARRTIGPVRDERHVTSQEGRTGPGEGRSTPMATFQRGMEHATDTGGSA